MSSAEHAYASKANHVLDSLDVYVSRNQEYLNAKEAELSQIKRSMRNKTGREKLKLIEYLTDEYRHVNIDSALYYVEYGKSEAGALNDQMYSQRFNILHSTVISVYGIVKEAVDALESIRHEDLFPDNKLLYYSSADLVYNYARDFYTIEEYKMLYDSKSAATTDSLLKILPPNTSDYLFHSATHRLKTAAWKTAVEDLEKLLKKLPFKSHLYARVAAIIGSAYASDPYHTEDAIYYLAQSAMSDISTGNRETTSLHRLGKLLYDKGDVDRSHIYLTTSLATAVESGSRLRSLEIAEALPLVFRTVSERDKNARRNLVLAIIVLSVLLLTALVLFLIYTRNRKRLTRMKERLATANELKDSYIKQILSLCGVYLITLENFNRLAGRKIKAGQVTDLLNMIESGKIIRDQLQTFYEVFDSAFLMIYPDFVTQINELLADDKRIVIREGERLTPELRIMAFMRLGLDDSNQISKFLGLSLNTVYTYRNKMKTRAKDRDKFEDQVRNIGKII